MRVLTIVIAVPVGVLSRRAVIRGWVAAHRNTAAEGPLYGAARWFDAIGWAILRSAGVVIIQLVSRKGAETTYRVVLGSQPELAKDWRRRRAEEALVCARRKDQESQRDRLNTSPLIAPGHTAVLTGTAEGNRTQPAATSTGAF